MATVIAIAAEKGGVGKTSMNVNVAMILAKMGKRVLVCDLDEQANTTYMLTGVKKKTDEFKGKGIYDMLRAFNIKDPIEYLYKTEYDNIWILPSNNQTPLASNQLITLEEENSESRFRFFMYCLNSLDDKFDYILCDTAPARNSLTMSALVASEYVMVPCVCDDFSMDALETTYNLMTKLSKEENVKITLLGVVLDIVEKYLLTDVVRETLKQSFYANQLFKAEIRKGQAVKDSLTIGKPVVISAPKSGPSRDYAAVTKEMLERISKMEKNAKA